MRTHGLGRLVAPLDTRDRDYPLRRVMRAARPVPRKSAYRMGALLDQGSQPSCTGAAVLGIELAAPLMVKHPERSLPALITEYYRAAQQQDEWPGQYYDGSSVRGAMKAMQARQRISNYVWVNPRKTTAVDELIAFMNGGYGMVNVGTDWYLEMDEVDRRGFIVEPSARATPVGGHSYVLNWYNYNPKVDGFLVLNSWGRSWGRKVSGQVSGTAYMSKALLTRLLRADGEAAAPTEVKLVKP